MRFIVTVKLPRRSDHNPDRKLTGTCPTVVMFGGAERMCSDVTGSHHSMLVEGETLSQAMEPFHRLGWHVTRVEEVST